MALEGAGELVGEVGLVTSDNKKSSGGRSLIHSYWGCKGACQGNMARTHGIFCYSGKNKCTPHGWDEQQHLYVGGLFLFKLSDVCFHVSRCTHTLA